jgi:hypothetical protein
MKKHDYQRKVDSIVGFTLGLLDSYELSTPAIKMIRKSLFEQLDRHFLEVVEYDEK